MAKKLTTIQVSDELRVRLNIMKQKWGCKNLEEVIDRILKIVPASELKKEEKNEPKKIVKKAQRLC